jgi:septal ring factor EnvC (AmiA/AmiB activator)
MSELSEQEAAALDQLRAPSGREVVERVHAERLGTPARLHVVDSDPAAEVQRLSEMLAALEGRVADEQEKRKEAEATANEMAVLVAKTRNELAEARASKETAEAAANEIAALIASENSRAREAEERATKAEEELRLAWAQVPMFEQSELSPNKPKLKGAFRLKR